MVCVFSAAKTVADFSRPKTRVITSSMIVMTAARVEAGITTRVSADSAGTEANAGSEDPPSISGNGRLVAFESASTNLVQGA